MNNTHVKIGLITPILAANLKLLSIIVTASPMTYLPDNVMSPLLYLILIALQLSVMIQLDIGSLPVVKI